MNNHKKDPEFIKTARTEELKTQQTTDERVGSFFQRFSKQFARFELWGHKAANSFHRFFINCILLFIAYNSYRFLYDYNEYWRLRRDSDIPKEWLAEQKQLGSEEWDMENERAARDKRLKASDL